MASAGNGVSEELSIHEHVDQVSSNPTSGAAGYDKDQMEAIDSGYAIEQSVVSNAECDALVNALSHASCNVAARARVT